MQAMKDWHKSHPHLFVKSPRNHTGCDGREDVEDYIVNNRLPRHPLVARGFASIGCAPCTSAVKPGEDPRAGRWRNSNKTECGIHFINGRAVPIQKENAA